MMRRNPSFRLALGIVPYRHGRMSTKARWRPPSSALAQALKPRGEDTQTAIARGRNAPDFRCLAAWVAAYPDRRRRRRSSEIAIRCD
jgi:hypothetical protein